MLLLDISPRIQFQWAIVQTKPGVYIQSNSWLTKALSAEVNELSACVRNWGEAVHFQYVGRFRRIFWRVTLMSLSLQPVQQFTASLTGIARTIASVRHLPIEITG